MTDNDKMKLGRRQLMIAGGMGGATLFLPSLFGKRAQAQAQGAPIKRLLILTQQHGTVQDRYRMLRNNSGYGNWEYPFDDPNPDSFSTVLRPLHARRADLLVLDGLSQASTLGDSAINNHNAGHLHILTGAKMNDDMNSGGPSVDQIIAKKVAVPGRIPSIELATRGPWIGGLVNLAANQRAPVATDPMAVFQRLFPAGASTPAPQQQPSERELIRAGRRSMLDFVSKEFNSVLPRLGAEDRARLSAHQEMLRDLEARIMTLTTVAKSCSAPGAPARGGNQVATAKAFADLTAAAFACDLTRVATIQVTQLENDEFGAPPGDMHQDFAHQMMSDPNAAEQMTRYATKHAEIFAYILDALRRYSDGSGTLLDSTAVMWVSELGNGVHDLDKIPIVLAGSAGGYFRTGRYISYAQDLPNPHEHPDWGDGASRPIGPGHSHVLISLMQAMGLSDNRIGQSSVVTRDGRNRTIDLTGPLPRLT